MRLSLHRDSRLPPVLCVQRSPVQRSAVQHPARRPVRQHRQLRSRLPNRLLLAALSEAETNSAVSGDDFAEMLQLAQGLQQDPEKPVYHVMSNKGWINVSVLWQMLAASADCC